MSDKYMYLFTRKDLSPQQQIIQTAHAAHIIGKNQICDSIPNAVLIGVGGEGELLSVRQLLEDNDIQHQLFFEPDIDEFTSIATFPIYGDQRIPLRGFSLM